MSGDARLAPRVRNFDAPRVRETSSQPPSSAHRKSTSHGRTSSDDGPPASRGHANETLQDTRFTHAIDPRSERCFLCVYVPKPPQLISDSEDPAAFDRTHHAPFDNPERSIVARMREYWEANVDTVDFRILAADCARLFQVQYTCFFLPPEESATEDGEPPAPCVADADMIYTHFMRHECTPITRRATAKRAHSDLFEFMEANKRAAFTAGKHGKRMPCREAAMLHRALCSSLIQLETHLDKLDAKNM